MRRMGKVSVVVEMRTKYVATVCVNGKQWSGDERESEEAARASLHTVLMHNQAALDALCGWAAAQEDGDA